MRRVREPRVEVELVARRQREAGGVGVAVDVVEIDAVEALRLALIEACVQDRLEDGLLADVEPALVVESADRIPFDRVRVRARVGPEGLPGAGVEIADHTVPGRVEGGYRLRRRVEQVHLVERRVERLVERARELDLPARDGGVARLTVGNCEFESSVRLDSP